MAYYLVKLILSALIIVVVTEISKKDTLTGALLVSLPLVSLLALIWLYVDTGNTEKVIQLSRSIFWLVLPSLTFFLLLPVLLQHKVNFYAAIALATGIMVLCYWLLVLVLTKLDVKL